MSSATSPTGMHVGIDPADGPEYTGYVYVQTINNEQMLQAMLIAKNLLADATLYDLERAWLDASLVHIFEHFLGKPGEFLIERINDNEELNFKDHALLRELIARIRKYMLETPDYVITHSSSGETSDHLMIDADGNMWTVANDNSGRTGVQ